MRTVHNPMSGRRGFAITVVLLVSVVAILAFLFSSATLTIASRSAAAQERNAAQALLAADSGLRTLGARATVTPYSAADGTFEAWIEANFGSLDLGDGVQVALDVVDEDPDQVIVQATGTSGTSRRIVVQAFEVVSGPPIPASATVPGALTSVGTIDNSSGAALVAGRENTDAEWTYAGVDLCQAVEGEYVEYASALWRVDGPPTCSGTMALTRVDGIAGTATPSGTQDVTLRPTAIRETLLVDSGTSTSEVRVTAGTRSLFGVGSPISVGTASGTVSGVAEETEGGITHQVLTIDWTKPGPAPTSGVYTEGAVVRRGVVSGVTNGACDVKTDKKTGISETFPDGCLPGQDLSNLFFKTFGVSSPELLFESLPESQRLDGSDIVSSRTLSGITWVTNPDNNFRDQTGSGILIVENNPGQQLTLNVSNDFVGLIYVIGDAKVAGSGSYTANAIVVDGVLNLDVDVQGTTDIAYDPLAISRAIAGITFPNPDVGGLGAAIANTWRVR